MRASVLGIVVLAGCTVAPVSLEDRPCVTNNDCLAAYFCEEATSTCQLRVDTGPFVRSDAGRDAGRDADLDADIDADIDGGELDADVDGGGVDGGEDVDAADVDASEDIDAAADVDADVDAG